MNIFYSKNSLARIFLFLLCLIYSNNIIAQLSLKPSIGVSSLPNDTDSVCTIPTYIDPDGTFQTSGLQEEDTIPHFKLYQLSGDSLDIAEELMKGKPVLLIAASYTCPVFRDRVPDINTIVNTYSSDISIFIVYAIEAHPDVDISPYSGTVWTTSENQNDGILYRQPTTYLERKNIVSDMANNLAGIGTFNIVIDGPCNYWWDNFGPAPNNAYLINTDGVIFRKHGWFNSSNYGYDMSADIDSLLLLNSIRNLNSTSKNVKVDPNPFVENTLFTVNETSDFDIILFDATGRKLKEINKINQPNYTLNRENFKNGLYFYKIKNEEKIISIGKIIIQ